MESALASTIWTASGNDFKNANELLNLAKEHIYEMLYALDLNLKPTDKQD